MLTIYDVILMEEARKARAELMCSLMNQIDLTAERLQAYCDEFGSVTLHDTSVPDFTSGRITLFTAAVFYKRWATVRLMLASVPHEHLNLKFKMPHPIAPQTQPDRTALEIIEWHKRQNRDDVAYQDNLTAVECVVTVAMAIVDDAMATVDDAMLE